MANRIRFWDKDELVTLQSFLHESKGGASLSLMLSWEDVVRCMNRAMAGRSPRLYSIGGCKAVHASYWKSVYANKPAWSEAEMTFMGRHISIPLGGSRGDHSLQWPDVARRLTLQFGNSGPYEANECKHKWYESFKSEYSPVRASEIVKSLFRPEPENNEPQDDNLKGDELEDDEPQDDNLKDDELEDNESENDEPEDAEPEDAEPEDADPEDAEPKDADSEDADPEDADPEDVDPEDADPEDAKPEDADPEDAKPEDAGPVYAELEELNDLSRPVAANEESEVSNLESCDSDHDKFDYEGEFWGVKMP